ncbi:MAG TPA: glutamine-hydrolyzing GMP synthase subunit GuaA [Candidatus Syntrophoarchaeum butanivorans]|uniref:GMP synthase [glutamine-hydrolyzing] subunit B n=1 Tax=Candidatus Syntropharchaeum butanivorans TaxID=1839936 RepID=A0A1F2P6H8_9EURY|nr:MAG: GMP synthase, glutamine-hydrolyzing [Candidatus Syntrophoarchaeum butanivorans]RJS72418.1 MAG: glutamine-hydrolyzing GMP synthase subunit GuaA [Candidatus Syntrophoarchaeum sp. WYZ-LMO15]HDM37019.1 glutamine-hydrolyzing GMP synthase subunit GuaA [Candidatus Syntrophoarchaeum butanivorans]HEC56896.1 glutamine-hydrolyzing GMP synthase subunit GuaA [Candidatus Syntrophoarchaeum butanivorans]
MMDYKKLIEDAVKRIREECRGKAIIALSGGVDSSVSAVLAHRAIGEDLIPIFVDTGFMREGEPERIREVFGDMNLRVVDARERFLKALEGVSDPEEKRKIIGETFIRIFEEEARKVGARYLIQGTIYPDRIESEGGIKSHHNVGGLPINIEFDGIIEPIADLYKDEVRILARELGLPPEISERMPFPGPGLAVRIIGEVTREKLEVVRRANTIVEEELREFKPWQAFAAVVERGTGVKGDVRVHGWIVAVRAVESRDGMTASPIEIPWDRLRRISSRITGEIPDVARVVYDITPKPPATIEYE